MESQERAAGRDGCRGFCWILRLLHGPCTLPSLARRASVCRPLEQRLKYAFITTYKPVMDDEPFRAFDTMADYRQWCEENLPSWLGYGRATE